MYGIFFAPLMSLPAASLNTIRNCGHSESCGCGNISTPALPPHAKLFSSALATMAVPPDGEKVWAVLELKEARTPHDENLRPPLPKVVDNIAEHPGRGSLERSAGNVPFVLCPYQIHFDRGSRCEPESESPDKKGPFPGEPSSPPSGAGAGSGELVRSRHSDV